MNFLIQRQHLGFAALLMGASIFLSRFMGLIRDKVISYFYGASLEADIYFTSFVIPDFINYLLAGGYFSITLIPILAAYFNQDEDDAWRLFSSFFCWVCVGITALTCLVFIFAPQLTEVVAPGFSAEAKERLAFFLRIIAPAQAFFLVGACLTAILYLRRQFTVPALTPLIYNLAIILCGIAFLKFGMEGFCWGVVIGACFGSFLLPLWAVAKGSLKISLTFYHPALKKIIFLALPLMLGQSLVVLDEQFMRIFGSLSSEGVISLLNYARRITQVPIGVIAQAAGVASFPFLAALLAKNQVGEFNKTLNQALLNVILVLIPVCAIMILNAEYIIRLIYQQGSFSEENTIITSYYLQIMLLGLVFWGVQQLISRAFYARQNTLIPALVGTVASLAAIPIYFWAVKHFGGVGIAYTGLLGVIVYTLVLVAAWIFYSPKDKPQDSFRGIIPTAFQAAFLSCLALLPGYLFIFLAENWLLGYPLSRAALLFFVTGLFFVLFYLLLGIKFKTALVLPLINILPVKLRKLIIE